MVGDAGGPKFQAGSVDDHLAMVTGCSRTDDVTQAVVSPGTVSARPDDAGDDGATQATSELETKTAPTRLPLRMAGVMPLQVMLWSTGIEAKSRLPMTLMPYLMTSWTGTQTWPVGMKACTSSQKTVHQFMRWTRWFSRACWRRIMSRAPPLLVQLGVVLPDELNLWNHLSPPQPHRGGAVPAAQQRQVLWRELQPH